MSFNELLTCTRENIPITVVVFCNRQWGAEKKNQVVWFNDRYIGSNLTNPSFAEVATAMGLQGIKVSNQDSVSDAVLKGLENQKNGMTTVIEVNVSRHLGEPFRRDAMRFPKRLLDKYKNDIVLAESKTGQPADIKG